MVDVKTMVYNQLKEICQDVSDEFPDDFTADTQIQYTEEENRAQDLSGKKVCTSYVRYRIDIWNTKSTSQLAVQVDRQLNDRLGLVRSSCSDNNSPGRKHKIMRYEGIVFEEDERIVSTK